MQIKNTVFPNKTSSPYAPPAAILLYQNLGPIKVRIPLNNNSKVHTIKKTILSKTAKCKQLK